MGSVVKWGQALITLIAGTAKKCKKGIDNFFQGLSLSVLLLRRIGTVPLL